MTCYHPLIRRIHKGEWKIAKDGHRYEAADIISQNQYDYYDKLNEKNIFYYKYEKIPCQKCIGCRLDYSRQWATRCMLESKYYAQNWFVTLTYDEENKPNMTLAVDSDGVVYEPKPEWNGTLVPEDLKKFMKDLRRYWKYHFNQDNIRYYGCGEYGSQTKRPHYHLIIFNLNLSEDMLKPLFVNAEHQQIYECETIQKIWKKGLISVGNVTWSSCAYVARYITKKIFGPESEIKYLEQGQIPEFTRSSNKPGIGRQYYEDHKTEIYETDEVIQTTGKNKQIPLKPPKYYDRLYDIDYPEDMERIKNARKESGKKALKNKMSKTTLTQEEQMKAEERSKLLKTKKLIRSLE